MIWMLEIRYQGKKMKAMVKGDMWDTDVTEKDENRVRNKLSAAVTSKGAAKRLGFIRGTGSLTKVKMIV